MAKKDARAGGKYGGGHTTVVPAAGMIADIAHVCPLVTKISVGFIKAGLPSAQGKRRLKIQNDGSSLLLTVRDNTSQQEVRVYASDVEAASRIISAGAKKEGFAIGSS